MSGRKQLTKSKKRSASDLTAKHPNKKPISQSTSSGKWFTPKNQTPTLLYQNVKRMMNSTPGMLFYGGNKSEPFAIEWIQYNQGTSRVKEFVDFEKFCQAYDSLETDWVNWINVTGINNVEEMKQIKEFGRIPNTIMEQILDVTLHSSYKVTDQYFFNDLQVVSIKNKKIDYENICIYKSDQFIITFQERRSDIFDGLRERICSDRGIIRKYGLAYLYFSMLDAITDGYLDVLENTKYNIEILEENIIHLQSVKINQMHFIRKIMVRIKACANPLEALVNQIRMQPALLPIEPEGYLESLHNNLKRVLSEAHLQHETVNGIFEIYMMNNANDMNKVMTILTVFSAIFIPLSFLAGVFGMNFKEMPLIDNPYGFYYFVAGCLTAATGMILFFKWKKWF